MMIFNQKNNIVTIRYAVIRLLTFTFPTSLKKLNHIPFVISQIYRNFAAY